MAINYWFKTSISNSKMKLFKASQVVLFDCMPKSFVLFVLQYPDSIQLDLGSANFANEIQAALGGILKKRFKSDLYRRVSVWALVSDFKVSCVTHKTTQR